MPPSGDSATSSGTAGKGIIIGGAVQALEIAGGTLVSRGSATTDAEGNYALSIAGYTGGPMIVQIAGGGGATMKCDVQDGCGTAAFGETVPLTDAFRMRTLLPLVPDDAALTRCITPFTELATSRAQELAGGNAASITATIAANALSEVGDLAGGLDVARTCVVDLTDPAKVADADPTQLALSGLAAAVLAVDGGADPAAAITGLNTAFAGGQIAVVDLQDLISAASSELAAVSPGAETNVAYMAVQDDVDAVPEGQTTIDPRPSDNAAAPAVAQGKALIDEVRSLAMNLMQDAETGGSNAAVIAFGNELEAAGVALDAAPIGEAFGFAFDAAADFYATRADGSGSASTTLTSTDSDGTTRTATITVNKPASGNHTATVVGRVGDFTTNIAVSAPGNPVGGGTTPTNLAGAVTGTMRSAGSTGVEATFDGEASATALTYDEPTDRVDLQAASFAGTATFAQFGVADPFSFSGAVTLNAVACTSCADTVTDGDEVDDTPPLNLDLLSLTGTFGNDEGSFEASTSIDIDSASAASFDPRLPITAGNVLSGVVTVQLDASLTGFHAYRVALTADLNDIRSLDGGADGELQDVDATVTASLRRDGSTITITAVANPPTESSNVVDVSIANQDGVVLRFDNLLLGEAISGSVFVGETAVGTVEETDSGVILIRWADGSFESLG